MTYKSSLQCTVVGHNGTVEDLQVFPDVQQVINNVLLERERERFTTSIQPAMAHEDESVLMSRPLYRWLI